MQVTQIRNEHIKKIKMAKTKREKDQDDLKNLLFKDKEGGIRYDIRTLERKKVSWKALNCIITLIIAASWVIYGYQWNSKDALAKTYVKMVETNTENIAKNAKAVQTVLTQQLGISTNIDWIKKSLRRIEKSNSVDGE